MDDQERYGISDLFPEDETPQPTAEPAKAGGNIVLSLFDWMDSIVASVILVVLIFTFLFRIVAIDGKSMNNTLFHGDRVIIYNLFYEPKPGDIVVISRNVSNDAQDLQEDNKPIIKRVIAVAGDTVDIQFEDGIGFVYVNGVLRDEPYIKEYIAQNKAIYDPVSFPTKVKDGCIFVMGDNRNDSLDSRSKLIGNDGMIDTRYVLGRAIVRVFPFTEFGVL